MLLTAAIALLSCAGAGLLSLFLARRFFDTFFLARVEALREAINKVSEGGRNLEFETSGEDELAQIGRGIEAMLRDVRATEERLRDAKAAEAMGIMAGGLAHDINNLLAGTVGTASLLKERLEEDGAVPPEELKSSLELIENTGRKGEILVRDLLALARLERPRKATVNLAVIVEETAKLLRASTPPSVKIETRLPAGEPLALGSAEDMERILLNLSKNGIQAMTDMVPPERKRGGKLSIGVEAAETRAGENGVPEVKFWAIKVSDEGVGMKPEVLAHLFTPFFSTKSRRGGSGLGLAASKAIAEAQGGRLEASSAEGQGSTFTLILPAASTKFGQTLARHAPEA
jgi:signal transduction histidine kinase